MDNNKKTKQIIIMIPRKDADKLERLARKCGCTRDELVERALELYIAKHKIP